MILQIIIIIFLILILFYLTSKIIKEKLTGELNKEDIIYIHVGKTGGSTLQTYFRFNEIHVRKPIFDKNKNYVISIRHPIKRFVSAFNMFSNIIIEDNDYKKTVPEKLRRFKKYGYWISKEYDNLIRYFKSANNLAESITSKNSEKKKKALRLMNIDLEHIHKGISYYLDNGEFIEKHHKNIVYVTKQETLNDDIKKLANMLNMNINLDKQKDQRINKSKDEYLSPLAIKNLKDFFENTEYKTLQTLYNYGFIDKEYLDYCYTYNI